MEEPEIPFACMTFEAEDPADINLEETGNDRGVTLKVGKMSFDYSKRIPGVKFSGVCLQFCEFEKTSEGKTRGVVFYSNSPESLHHLIISLMKARNQMLENDLKNQK